MNSRLKSLILNRLLFVLVLLALITFPTRIERAAPAAQNITYQEDFNDGQAQGWELEPGWSVKEDGGNYVLAGEGHVWARSNQYLEGDYRLAFRLKLIRGTIHLIDRNNEIGRYFIGFTSSSSSLNMQFWPDEFHQDLEHSDRSHSLLAWHDIEIVSTGNTLSFHVDGQQEWTHVEDESLTSGLFAFETLDGAQAYIDDIVVTSYSGQPAAATSAPAAATPAPAAQSASASNFTWVRTGGPIGGLGYDIRMQPDNPDIMYVTDAWAGAFKSTDGGNTWFQINTGIDLRTGQSGDAIPVFCITIDPNNYNILWAGLQNLGGIYRSDNGGQTWEKRTRGIVEQDGLSIRGISIEPGNSNIIYAAGEISSWRWKGSISSGREFDRTMGVVYKSTDGGENWQAIWRGDSLARYIWIDPTDMKTLYVSTGIFDREAANSYWDREEAGGVGILKSTDGGQNWRQVNNGLQNLYIGTLFMHPRDPHILLAGAGNNAYPEGAGIYLTTDGGENWVQVGLESSRITSVEFASSDPNIAYAGGAEIFLRSEDGGKTWSEPETTRVSGWGPAGIQAGFPIDFQVDPRDPNRVFVNNYGGGNFLTEDGGKTWISSSTGYTGADLNDVSIDPLQPGLVYVNGRSGPFVSWDAGGSWQGINPIDIHPIVEGARIALDPTNPDHILVSSAHWGWTFNSKDGGTNWELVSDYYDELMNSGYSTTNPKFQGFEAITFTPSNPRIVYGGFGIAGCLYWADPATCSTGTILSILISRDGGSTWQPVEGTALDGQSISEIVVHPQQADTAWASSMGGGVYFTTDGGATWQNVSNGLSDKVVLGLALDPNNPQILFAGSAYRGIFKSDDGGKTWRSSSAGMDPNEQISSIVVDPMRSNVIYAGSWKSGVFISEDGGKTWRLIKDGLSTRSVRALAISADGNHLYAVTRGEGVFRLDLNGQPPPTVANPQIVPTTQASIGPTQSVEESLKTPSFKIPSCSGFLLLILAVIGWRATNGHRKFLHR
ncbi:MAG: hypothetical protein A2Y54_04930 [Chloroflexi bacterium RBG_16_51_16]|nr:MAG: hypothetical protein A2Y54_04930 [Chloroflexi bacterium RBG_16_51_16]